MTDFIPGTTLEEDMTSAKEDFTIYVSQVYQILRHLWKIKVTPGCPPGPTDGGEPLGYLYGDKGSGCHNDFRSTQHMNDYLNIRLKAAQDCTTRGAKSRSFMLRLRLDLSIVVD